MIKRQLYSGTFTLNAAASFIFGLKKDVALLCLYFAHNCTEYTLRLLPSRSEATSHENHLYMVILTYMVT